MRLSSVPPALKETLSRCDDFLLLGHDYPDADVLCSQLSMGLLLKKLGKGVRFLSKGPFSRPEIRSLGEKFESQWPYPSNHKTLLILLDCGELERTGFPLGELRSYDLMIIDHHPTSVAHRDHDYIEHDSPSTTLLIQAIWENLGIPLDAEAASYLFFGFATDTGFFRHLPQGSGEILQRVSRLVDAGAQPNKIFRQIEEGRELASRRLLGRILERAAFHCGGRVIFSWENQQDRDELQVEDRDSDKLYLLLQSIQGCQAVAIIREKDGPVSMVGLRSWSDAIDVSHIAALLGGGGHVKAAGCKVKKDRHETQALLIKLFEEHMDG